MPDDDSNPPSPVAEKRMPGDMPGKVYDRRMPGDMPGRRIPELVWASPAGSLLPVTSVLSILPSGSTLTRRAGDCRETILAGFRLSHPDRLLGRPLRTNFSGRQRPRATCFARSAMKRPSVYSFSPSVPVNTMRHNFPLHTPGKAPRGSAPEINGRSLRQDDACWSCLICRIPTLGASVGRSPVEGSSRGRWPSRIYLRGSVPGALLPGRL